MASGMEMMLAKMIGISPDDLNNMVTSGAKMLRQIGDTMARLETKQNLILQNLEVEFDDAEIDKEIAARNASSD